MTQKVEILIGVPCSGKSTYRGKTYNPETTFIVSRDDIKKDLIEEYGIDYQSMYKRPQEGDPQEHPLFGVQTESGEWSKVKEMNDQLSERFDIRKKDSIKAIFEGKDVVFDMTNLTVKEREEIKDLFKDFDVDINAINFKFEGNEKLIKELNQKRGEQTNNFIPEFIIDDMMEKCEFATLDEGFSNVVKIDGLSSLKPKPKRSRGLR
tara:strand:- start:1466 stop:2086 length:621 start_codon:yes stop_codon:yes gene_type:complete